MNQQWCGGEAGTVVEEVAAGLREVKSKQYSRGEHKEIGKFSKSYRLEES